MKWSPDVGILFNTVKPEAFIVLPDGIAHEGTMPMTYQDKNNERIEDESYILCRKDLYYFQD